MNSLKLVIGNKNYSSWSLRPWFFMKNLGIEFDEEMVFLFEEGTANKLSPYFSNEKVPLLVTESIEVWDTLAIIEFINDKFPELQGWPASPDERAVARSISAEMHSSFFALRDALPMNCREYYPNHPIDEGVQIDIDRIVRLWEHSSKNYGSSGPWLFGDFSGADAMYAPVVLRLTGYDVKLTGFAADYTQMVLENQHMQDWFNAGKKETQIIAVDEI